MTSPGSFLHQTPAGSRWSGPCTDAACKLTGLFTALVVDANPVMLRLASAMLRRLGFAVRTAGESAEALFEFHRSPSKLVLTDYEMPAINGYQLGRRIKAQLPRTRVVIMTGSGRDAVAGIMSDEDIDGWLFKPFHAEDLERLLRRIGLLVGGGEATEGGNLQKP